MKALLPLLVMLLIVLMFHRPFAGALLHGLDDTQKHNYLVYYYDGSDMPRKATLRLTYTESLHLHIISYDGITYLTKGCDNCITKKADLLLDNIKVIVDIRKL